ncbi:hypothetical protein RCG23_04100 [Neobacillus sp. PS3-34]|uniref:hypothetical protein n=1 Tax=Neobacillus sp. PS3-34 TaxID=3070678 RepID=UPI0027DF64EE|nr:hypothetical protein [Neobacillus sp. PS3-34]WML49261.1 hypothetical protein RCG23_04100 [Neobacillus sp. PS3-34]
MSLKLVELQIALPRTYEAGKIQEQLQHRGQIANDHAALEMQKIEDQARSTVVKQEQKGQAELNQDGHGSQQNSNERKKNQNLRSSEHPENLPEKHPYKGTIIDFSG